jgi:thioredoxin reductase
MPSFRRGAPVRRDGVITVTEKLPIAIIGAGPIGLAAAAHLLARGELPLVMEAGDSVGHTVRQWSHVSMFSPWQYNIDQAAAALLTVAGWDRPQDNAIPTGGDLVSRYLEPLAALPLMRPHIRFGTRVVAVTRKGLDKVKSAGRADRPFTLRIETSDRRQERIEARAVIDASGTWTSPNPAGSDGLPARGEMAASDRIAYGIPDILHAERDTYADRTVMVVGGGHSALNALIELGQLRQSAPKTSIVWVLRKPQIEAAFGGEAADALPARGALGIHAHQLVDSGAVRAVSAFFVSEIAERSGKLAVKAEDGTEIIVDRMIVATGFRPDFSLLREIRLTLDPWLESSGSIGPLIDPNLHSCGTVRPHGAKELAHEESGFFIVGMKSYGRAPTFLLATGHEQVRSIVAHLTGDAAAAARVELKLPETGVCSTRPIVSKPVPSATGSCSTNKPELAVVAPEGAGCAPKCCA